jgi:hypothetical protein
MTHQTRAQKPPEQSDVQLSPRNETPTTTTSSNSSYQPEYTPPSQTFKNNIKISNSLSQTIQEIRKD